MIKCDNCNKLVKVENIHRLNKKNLGSGCYKKELILLQKEKTKIENEMHIFKVDVLKSILEKRSNKNYFIKSLLNTESWTLKQLSAIYKSLTKDEKVEYSIKLIDFNTDLIQALDYSETRKQRKIKILLKSYESQDILKFYHTKYDFIKLNYCDVEDEYWYSLN